MPNRSRLYKSYIITATTIPLLLSGGSAWADAGAQYSCSSKTTIFKLLPHDDEGELTDLSLEPGFKSLPTGISNIKCKLGKYKLNTQIGIIPAQGHGECLGNGAVNVISLGVNNVELAKNPFLFNWPCPHGEKIITKIEIKTFDSIVELEKCKIDEPSNLNPTPKTDCSSESFNIDKIAAENAKIDYQLADIETQKSQSATNLPSENDLAQFFATSNPSDLKIPLCAHWNSNFLSAITAPERQRHGRIAGNEGERVYIHPANPQLCKNPDDDGCTAISYLIPGDRIDVGFICGDWTQIQYKGRLNSQHEIRGWVETSKLYAVDPVVLPTKPAPAPKIPDDVLLQAIIAKNKDEIKRLIAAGTDPDGQKKEGFPLDAAIETNDLEIVKLVLQLGANVNAKSSTGYNKCHILNLGINNQEIFDILVKAGIDLNCQGGRQNPSPLMEAAEYRRLWGWEWKYDKKIALNKPIKNPLQLVKRLLVAGADPNIKDYEGKTALFYAIEANNIDVARLLLDSGANPSISIDGYNPEFPTTGNQLGSTPLMAAMTNYSVSFDPTMFELLLTNGAAPNYRNPSIYDEDWDSTTSGAVTFAGQTVLTRAAEDGYFTLARLALEHGADTSITRQDGLSAKDIAMKFKHQKIADLIEEYEKKQNTKTTPPKKGAN